MIPTISPLHRNFQYFLFTSSVLSFHKDVLWLWVFCLHCVVILMIPLNLETHFFYCFFEHFLPSVFLLFPEVQLIKHWPSWIGALIFSSIYLPFTLTFWEILVLVSWNNHNNIPYTGGLNNRNLFLIVLEARESKIKVLADLVAWQSPFPALQVAALSLYLHMAEGGNSVVPSSSYKGTNPIMGAPSSGPYLNIITSQRPHLLTPSHWGLELQYINLGQKHSVHNNSLTSLYNPSIEFLIFLISALIFLISKPPVL